VINVFRAMANAETLYPYFSNLLLRLFQPLELDKALERMIVLRVANQSAASMPGGKTEWWRTASA
jgi:hypothetical protein